MSPETTPSSQPQHSRPLWFAALVTGAGAVSILFIVGMSIDILDTRSFDTDTFVRGLGVAAMVIPLGAALMLLIALPVAAWLRSLRRLSLINLCVAGCVAGLGVAALWFVLDYPSTYPIVFVIGLITGFVLALAFALIAGVRLRSSKS